MNVRIGVLLFTVFLVEGGGRFRFSVGFYKSNYFRRKRFSESIKKIWGFKVGIFYFRLVFFLGV